MASKINLQPPMALADVRSKALVLLFFFFIDCCSSHCLWELSVISLLFFCKVPFEFCNHLVAEERTGCFLCSECHVTVIGL